MRKCTRCGTEHGNRHAYCLACRAAYARETRPKYSELTQEQRKRALCRSQTKMLIKRGVLPRIQCVSCGDPKSVAHHPDYNNPRRVVWLCRPCHLEHHASGASEHWLPVEAPPEGPHGRIWRPLTT